MEGRERKKEEERGTKGGGREREKEEGRKQRRDGWERKGSRGKETERKERVEKKKGKYTKEDFHSYVLIHFSTVY